LRSSVVCHQGSWRQSDRETKTPRRMWTCRVCRRFSGAEGNDACRIAPVTQSRNVRSTEATRSLHWQHDVGRGEARDSAPHRLCLSSFNPFRSSLAIDRSVDQFAVQSNHSPSKRTTSVRTRRAIQNGIAAHELHADQQMNCSHHTCRKSECPAATNMSNGKCTAGHGAAVDARLLAWRLRCVHALQRCRFSASTRSRCRR
jgi:hypothetical protein